MEESEKPKMEHQRNKKGQFAPGPKRPGKFKTVRPRSPLELMRAIHCGQLKQTTKQAKDIAQIRKAVEKESLAVGNSLLENSLACLAVISQELMSYAFRSGQIIDAKGNLHPSLTQRNYCSYQAAMRQTILALEKLKGSAPSPDDLRKSPADLILAISNDFEKD